MTTMTDIDEVDVSAEERTECAETSASERGAGAVLHAALPRWRRSLVAAWYYGTLAYRMAAAATAARVGRSPVMVLFYHRVADEHPNAWTISTADFRRHLDWLAPRFDLVSLAEAQRRIAEGNHRPAVSITFDDGYADNSRFALPLLIERRIPCTYFVSLEHVSTGRPFPHDSDAGRPLAPNTIEELRELATAGIDIGGHTRTHADLGSIADPNLLYDELIAATRELEDAVGHAVRYFAFPYGQPGNLTGAAMQLAREHGLWGVCSAWGAYNVPGDDPFHLRRIHADADIRFKNWLTVDPRKTRNNSSVSRGDL
jgi:peptidoglycan/xylan/chitin deacetylase (PgdA/CDA1 family)